ncbi:MAG: cyclic lactone autoinducer peptide [Alistipes sp.]|nr:cyclic lactone autoinducer peptide [Alistipes sp.]
MKKNLKENVLKAIAKAGKISAVVGANSASVLGYHQPKESEAVRKLRKS